MSSRSRTAAVVLLSVSALCLGGCAFLRGSAAGTAFVASGQQQLRLPGANASVLPPMAYRDPFVIEEYARSTDHGRAEALFLRTQGLGTALDLEPRDLAYVTQRWAFNARRVPLAWQQPRQSMRRGSRFYYRRYRLASAAPASARACVAFMHTWDYVALDPQRRPGRGYVGYHCAPVGASLTDAAARRYLQRIVVAKRDNARDFHLGQAVPRDADALAAASARADRDWGFSGFPFRRTRHYPIGASYSAGG